MSKEKDEKSSSDLKQPLVIKTAGELDRIVRKILMAAGADESNANRVAEALVSSDLCGVYTHGVWQLPNYVEWMKTGEIDPTAKPSVLSETSNTALVSGNWTFGHVTARLATEIAIAKAQEHNLSLVSLVRLHHIGRLGEYVELAASKGLISMVWAGGFSEEVPAAVPYGGRKRVLHTNPIAMAFPANGRPSMMFDFATTALSGVKVVEARTQHQQLPAGSIVDKDGNPTTDPVAFFEGGGYLPFGGHKGYALMLAAEYLGRILSGSDALAQQPLGGPIFGHSGATIIAFRADLFQGAREYQERAQEFESRIRSTPAARGFNEVLMPGDVEARTRVTYQRDGIPIPERMWAKLADLAGSLGISDF